jgi:IclR family transcriptional regulator, acetate operon repressor
LLLLQLQSRELMRAASRPGDRSPLACTAMGKAILAAMPNAKTTEFVQHGGLQRLTPQSIARPTVLHSVLEEVRRVGYAVDNEETTLGVRCVAAAIFDELSVPVAALCVVGPTMRITLERMEELGHSAILTAREITVAFGGRPPVGVWPSPGRPAVAR